MEPVYHRPAQVVEVFGAPVPVDPSFSPTYGAAPAPAYPINVGATRQARPPFAAVGAAQPVVLQQAPRVIVEQLPRASSPAVRSRANLNATLPAGYPAFVHQATPEVGEARVLGGGLQSPFMMNGGSVNAPVGAANPLGARGRSASQSRLDGVIRQRSQSQKRVVQNEGPEPIDSDVCRKYSYADLAKATKDFDDSRRLGKGLEGTVYKASLNGSHAAVKVIDLSDDKPGRSSELPSWQAEVSTLSKYRHANLVTLQGWAREGNKGYLIYEFLSGGDCEKKLEKSKNVKEFWQVCQDELRAKHTTDVDEYKKVSAELARCQATCPDQDCYKIVTRDSEVKDLVRRHALMEDDLKHGHGKFMWETFFQLVAGDYKKDRKDSNGYNVYKKVSRGEEVFLFRRVDSTGAFCWCLAKQLHGQSQSLAKCSVQSQHPPLDGWITSSISEALPFTVQPKDLWLWNDRLKVATEAARGLSHMMDGTEKSFHRDIKPANILVDDEGRVKVADFGLARHTPGNGEDCLQDKKYRVGTKGYMCPEYLKTGKISDASEVYSFGVFLLQLLVNLPPAIPGQGKKVVFLLEEMLQPKNSIGVHERIWANRDLTAQWPKDTIKDFGKIALDCVREDPARRPKFYDVVKQLEDLDSGLMNYTLEQEAEEERQKCSILRDQLFLAVEDMFKNGEPEFQALKKFESAQFAALDVEAVLECTSSQEFAHLNSLPLRHKCIPFIREEGPSWAFGRTCQPSFFDRLVTAEGLRNMISRKLLVFNVGEDERLQVTHVGNTHVTVNGGTFRGYKIPDKLEHKIWDKLEHGAEIKLWNSENDSPFLTFRLLIHGRGQVPFKAPPKLWTPEMGGLQEEPETLDVAPPEPYKLVCVSPCGKSRIISLPQTSESVLFGREGEHKELFEALLKPTDLGKISRVHCELRPRWVDSGFCYELTNRSRDNPLRVELALVHPGRTAIVQKSTTIEFMSQGNATLLSMTLTLESEESSLSMLEVRGLDVNAPPCKCRVQIPTAGVTIGRSHHVEVVPESFHKFISGKHFRVTPKLGDSREYELEVLGQNAVWVKAKKDDPDMTNLCQGQRMSIHQGADICLHVGQADPSKDLGRLMWTIVPVGSEHEAGNSTQDPLTINAICGDWDDRAQGIRFTIDSDGVVYLNGEPNYDLEERVVNGTNRIIRGDGWEMDLQESSNTKLKWFKNGYEPLFWYRKQAYGDGINTMPVALSTKVARTTTMRPAMAGSTSLQLANITGLERTMSLTISWGGTKSETKTIVSVAKSPVLGISSEPRRPAQGSVAIDSPLQNSYLDGSTVVGMHQGPVSTKPIR